MRQKKFLLKVIEGIQNKTVRRVKKIIIKITGMEEKLKSVIFLRKEKNLHLSAS